MHQSNNQKSELTAKVVSTSEELLQVFAVRAAVYMAEQDCPYEEEFDGNDYCGTHILGLVNGKPAGCVRIRWFADFVKAERMTVLKQYRGTRMSELILQRSFDLVSRKGYRRYHVHAQRRLVGHWEKFGMRPISNKIFHFSDHEYVSMVLALKPPENAINEETDPMVLIRPEDDFDHPGILELSAERPPTNPIGNFT